LQPNKNTNMKTTKTHQPHQLLTAIGAITLITLGILLALAILNGVKVTEFDGDLALQDVYFQTSLGSRIPGSEAHENIVDWIVKRTEGNGWIVELHETEINQISVRNIIAKNRNEMPEMIIGAHYDSRMYADKDIDPQKRTEPVPGANDGASGVAVLLELTRTLPEDLAKDVWLVFFDAEDNGNIAGWDWILGSQAFVRDYAIQPEAVVIIDMIGDKDLNIHLESNSHVELSNEIWDVAAKLGYREYFIPTPKYRILDDHIPFIRAGMRAIDIIDFDYAHWHTSEDTPDKVSADSLEIVGKVLHTWLLQK